MYHGQIVSSYNSLFGTWDARIPVLPRIAYATRHICPFHCSLNRRPRDSLASLALVVITTTYYGTVRDGVRDGRKNLVDKKGTLVSGRRWYRSVVKKGKKKQKEGRESGGRKEGRGERDRVTEGGLIPIKNFLESVKKKKKKKTIPPLVSSNRTVLRFMERIPIKRFDLPVHARLVSSSIRLR